VSVTTRYLLSVRSKHTTLKYENSNNQRDVSTILAIVGGAGQTPSKKTKESAKLIALSWVLGLRLFLRSLYYLVNVTKEKGNTALNVSR